MHEENQEEVVVRIAAVPEPLACSTVKASCRGLSFRTARGSWAREAGALVPLLVVVAVGGHENR